MTPPFALTRETLEPHHVTQSRLDRPALEVHPIEGCRAGSVRPLQWKRGAHRINA